MYIIFYIVQVDRRHKSAHSHNREIISYMGKTMNETDQRLAQRLITLRQERGWTLEQLAKCTSISRATLSRIERAEISPTATLLNKLCVAYGLTMSRLLSEVEENVAQHLTPPQQPVWQDREQGFIRRGLSPPASGYRAEMIEGVLRPGALIAYDAPPVPGIEQHIWLLAGVLIIEAGGARWRLEAGDTLRFHLYGASAFHAPEAEGARYLLVVCR